MLSAQNRKDIKMTIAAHQTPLMRGYLSAAGTTDSLASGMYQKRVEPGTWLQHLFILAALLFHEWNRKHRERSMVRLIQGDSFLMPFLCVTKMPLTGRELYRSV
ncbi:hypothetical protein SAMN02745161_3080 [Halodesulfovibrio marinisediminis DSM 17456]|uniref:Uncharacterized protein n=1 Tax=Halodesulfovibrio marinisediminis DSM 17456 TaxID=1121457 RepID=A0A1N6J1V2_9BACT|nr:hypothetical protein SAMN02745161_3080 [Halodesulfovibrio marinisediminis DSM 17456]